MSKLIVAASISVLLVLSGSCGSSSPVNPVISDGSWTGSVLGQSITFTVEGNHVRDLQVTFIYIWGSSLPDDTVSWTPDDALISDNMFSMSDTLSNGYYSFTMSINGTFDPPSDVSGMFATEGHYDSLGTHYSTSDSLSWSGTHN